MVGALRQEPIELAARVIHPVGTHEELDGAGRVRVGERSEPRLVEARTELQ
jgi:hypothetical protein